MGGRKIGPQSYSFQQENFTGGPRHPARSASLTPAGPCQRWPMATTTLAETQRRTDALIGPYVEQTALKLPQ